jgi:hypothetical protein
MTTMSVDLEGVPAVEASLAAVAAALQDPDTAEAAVRLVQSSADPLVPRAKGTLAASAQTTGPRLVYAAPYSAIVQSRDPWLGAGITEAVPRILALYETQAVQAWD